METAQPDLPERLLKGCLNGNPACQKELYKSFYGFALAICLRYATDRDEAVEIMNNGFYKVLTQLDHYNPEKPFKPWLRRIMTNKAIDHYRSRLRFAYAADITEVEEKGVEASAYAKLNYEDLLKMVQQLPPGYRAVFNLYAIDGYTHEEIAGMLKISVGTSKSNLFKARQKLREFLNDENSAGVINLRGSDEINKNEEVQHKPDRSVFQGQATIARTGI